MRKIEIVTLHRVTNFGSLLQTLALQHILEDMGYEVEVLDFVPVGLSFSRALWPHNGNSIAKKVIKFIPNFLMNILQYNMMNRFIAKYINVSVHKYSKYKDIINKKPEADIFMTGSDQVWNTQNDNEPDDLKAYYLCFVPTENKKLSYASSFGRDEFSENEISLMYDWLNDYDSISVREDTGLKLLNQMGIFKGKHVLDPTLLITSDEWRELLSIRSYEKEYVFVYNLNRNKLVEKVAQSYAKKNNLKIINFADSYEFIPGAKNRIYNTPIDFIKYIANAKAIVTDSFHGTAFAINFHKNFVSIPAPKFNSRIESILRTINLLDSRFCNSINAAEVALAQDIDWKSVDSILTKKREDSFDFLREALNE